MLLPGVKPGWNTDETRSNLNENLNPPPSLTTPRWKMVSAGKDGGVFFFFFFKYHKIFSVNVELTYVHVVSGLGSSDSISLFIAGSSSSTPSRSVWWKWLKCHLSHSSNSFRLILIISWKEGEGGGAGEAERRRGGERKNENKKKKKFFPPQLSRWRERRPVWDLKPFTQMIRVIPRK